jgi:cytochrome c oxidase assembly protein subunit 11
MTSLAQRFDPRLRTAFWAAMLAAGMVGLGFAAVPLYDLFCRVTGFGGTTMRATEAEANTAAAQQTGRIISVRFDSNVRNGLPWSFRPERPRETLSVGARDMMIFIAKNESSVPVTGTATFNVTPSAAGRYFSKIQCFCFTEQTLQPGQEMRMPVVYFVNPAMLEDPDARDIQEITLSYTFFPVDEAPAGS